MNKEEWDQNIKILKKRKWRQLPLEILLLSVGFVLFFLTGNFGAFLLGIFAAVSLYKLTIILSSKMYEKWIENPEEKEARKNVEMALVSGTVPKNDKEE